MLPRKRQKRRGTSIIEGMVAMLVLSIGMLGIAGVQTVAVRSNTFGQRLAFASTLAADLTESAHRWAYTDARLAARASVTSTTDARIDAFWKLNRTKALTTAERYSFAEAPSDLNAITSNALGATYQGLSGDVNKDGSFVFKRYWNVWDVDLAGSGTSQGKLLQVVVRWSEPGFGMRQVQTSSFLTNPAALFQ